jgi:hypothetical protein
LDLTPLEQQIGDLDVAIDRLRSLYDQYFMGIERIEPAVPRKDVERKIHSLRKEQIRNTALRFRFQMILQRYSTFQAHWQRICREIENGTYKRLLYRAERRRFEAAEPRAAADPEPVALREPASLPDPVALPAPGAPPSRNIEAELEELDREFAPATPRGMGPPATRVVPAAGPPAREAPAPAKVGQAPPPRRPPPPPLKAPAAPAGAPAATPPVPEAAAPAAPAAPPARRDGGLPEYRVRQLYVEYVEAKRRQKESTASLTYEALAESLRASSVKLREKHGKPIDFEVGIKDGKAVLRPRVK